MATMDELKLWLEVARSLFPKAGFVVLVVSLVYLARQTWRTREDWRFGPPWSASARYIKKLHAEFGYAHRLDFGDTIALHIRSSQPAVAQRFNPNEVYTIENLMHLARHEHQAVIITGPAANGKTALLHALALRASLPPGHRALGFAKPGLPFYIPAKHVDPRLPFVPALARSLKQSNHAVSNFALKTALRRGRALFLFDGFEEIAENVQRQNFLRWFDEAQQRVGQRAQFVLASRQEAWLALEMPRAPHLFVTLRNFLLQKNRSLTAVTETRMPSLLRHAESEFVLITPPNPPVLLRGANLPAPAYHFHLAKFPVTNKLYRAFVQTTGYRAPLFWQEKEFAADDLPVVGIDWEDAEKYCAWLNQLAPPEMKSEFVFRLPTEEEWEWAASGGQRVYPWGNTEPTEAHANFGEHGSRLLPVHAHPLGATPEGVHEMAGNVWEWTASSVQTKPEKRLVRGGAAFNEANVLQCLARDSHVKERSRFVGFRVVRAPLQI